MLSNNKILSIYINNNTILYVIKNRKDYIYNLIELTETTDDDKILIIIQEIKKLKKTYKPNKIYVVFGSANEHTKVIEKEQPIKKNINIVIKNEIENSLKQDIDINDLTIAYEQLDKEKKLFLITAYNKAFINKFCNLAEKENLVLDVITIPEIALYNLLKQKAGLNMLIYKRDNIFRAIVVKDGLLIYTINFNITDITNILEEIDRIKELIYIKLNRNIDKIYNIGDDDIPDSIEFNISNVQEDYLIPYGLLIK